jgi:hypothetical protein
MEIRYLNVDWIHLPQDREHGGFYEYIIETLSPKMAGKILTS